MVLAKRVEIKPIAPISPASPEAPTPRFYRHTRRPNWGLAIAAFKRPNKTAFQFADGKLRLFRNDFLHLFERVDVDLIRAEQLGDRLRRQAGIARNRRAAVRDAEREGRHIPSLDEQITWFKAHYPDGFAGSTWRESFRGSEGRRLKRHRDPLLAEARARLSASALSAMRDDPAVATDTLLDILDRASLVPPKDRRKLAALPRATQARIGAALIALLQGAEAADQGDGADFATRFDRWVLSLANLARWRMVTAPLAIVDPARHVCVTPSTFRRQARWMAPSLLEAPTRPTSATYQRWRTMVATIAERLDQASLSPRDCFDVHDFIKTTLAPSALGS